MGLPQQIRKGFNFLGRRWSVGPKIEQQVNNIQSQNIQQIVRQNVFNTSVSWNTSRYSDGVFAYSSSAGLYSIVNRIMKTAAIGVFKVYRVKDKKKHQKYLNYTGENATYGSVQKALQLKEQVYEEDNTHELNTLIDRPNKWCDGSTFVQNAGGFMLLNGNRYIRVRRLDAGANKGKPYELELLPPQFVTVVSNETELFGVKEYIFQMGSYREVIPAEEIIHTKTFNPDFDQAGNHLYGLSPLRVAAKNLKRDDIAEERSVIMMENGGAPGILFDESGDDDDATIEYNAKLKRTVNEEINGMYNLNEIKVANKKLGYISFGLDATDMKLLETEKFSMQKLCWIFGAPPGLFDPDKSGEHNASEFKKELITSAVLPVLNDLRADWNEIAAMFKKNDLYVDYDISAYPELQEDMDKVAARLEKMWYWTGNQKRIATGQDEDMENKMMNTYLVPSGLTPIDQLNVDNTNDLLNGMTDEEDTTGGRAAGTD